MDPIRELTFRAAGAPCLRRVGELPVAATVHELALALGAAAVHERAGLGEGEEPSRHVIPIADRGTLTSREACTLLRWQGLGAEGGRSLGPRALDHLRFLLEQLKVERPEDPPEHAGA